MGLFKNSILSSAGKGKQIKSYALVVVCAILVICNLAFFLTASKMAPWLAVLLSNAITIGLLLLAIRPINSLMQKEFSRQAHELVEKEKEELAMKQRITELEAQNRELESRLDTWSQTAGMPSNVILTSKVETMTFNKSGYIVKEEPLEGFKADPAYGLQEKKGFLEKFSNLINPGKKRVLYIAQYNTSAVLGLDFGKICFAVQKDTLYLYGINIAKLHDQSSSDVNHCWILSGDSEDEQSLSLSGSYKEFLDIYKAERQKETAQAVETEMEGLCRMYTDTFRRSLSQRFPGLAFVDSMDDPSLTWLPLGQHLRDERINRIATNMFLMATALNGYFDMQQSN